VLNPTASFFFIVITRLSNVNYCIANFLYMRRSLTL
jgi:hypothetical protein